MKKLIILILLLVATSCQAQDWGRTVHDTTIQNFNVNLDTTRIPYLSKNNVFTGVNTWNSNIITRRIYLVNDSIAIPYNTIASAISAWSRGKTILLSGGTFSENIILNQDSMIIVGMSKENTKINNLSIRGKDCVVRNLTIGGDCSIINSTVNYFKEGTEIIECILLGNINIGSSDTVNSYPFIFRSCDIIGESKSINSYNECYNNVFFDCFIKSGHDTSMLTINIYQGHLGFNSGRQTNLKSLYLNNANHYVVIGFKNCQDVEIFHGIFNDSSNNNYAVFVFIQTTLLLADTTTWTINGKVELDLWHCKIGRPSIVFNSTAMSRWEYTTDVGWGTQSTITGTGVGSLHIYYSIFGCPAPAGLGRDAYNAWNNLLDA